MDNMKNEGAKMKSFKVEINDGTRHRNVLIVQARYHEEAERMALLAANIKYENVVTMTAVEVNAE